MILGKSSAKLKTQPDHKTYDTQKGFLMDFQPLSGREFPRFSAIKTFFRLPHIPFSTKLSPEQEAFELGIMGIPFDGGVSYRPGARFAPTHIRNASSLGRGFHWTRAFSVFEKLKIADLGDCSSVPLSIDQTYKLIEDTVTQVLQKNKKIIMIGGDHSCTLPILRAHKQKHGPIRLIHFDAHLDTYPAAWGCEYHHGAFLRHAIEEGLVKECIQYGIRGPLASATDLAFVKKHNVQVNCIDDIRQSHLNDFLKTIPAFDSMPTYISFDIDCMDPAFAPGTGTPVPGGLSSYECQRILRSLKIPNLVGADIVEVCPAYDHADITALAAVDVLFELMCLMAESKK